jgi:hypothetical protein
MVMLMGLPHTSTMLRISPLKKESLEENLVCRRWGWERETKELYELTIGLRTAIANE